MTSDVINRHGQKWL